MMRRHVSTILLLAVVITGCSGNGGSTGTGVSQLTGNVSSLESAKRISEGSGSRLAWIDRIGAWFRPTGTAHAQTSLEGIRVAIVEFGLETTTDAGGSFAISGGFADRLTVSFDREEDGVSGTVDVRVPLGGRLALEDVRIEGNQAVPAARRLDFEGVLVERNCPGNALFVASRFDPDGPVFEIRVDTSSIRDRQGRPFDCEDLVGGDPLDVRGFVEDDGRVGNAEVDRSEQAENPDRNGGDDRGSPQGTPTPQSS